MWYNNKNVLQDFSTDLAQYRGLIHFQYSSKKITKNYCLNTPKTKQLRFLKSFGVLNAEAFSHATNGHTSQHTISPKHVVQLG